MAAHPPSVDALATSIDTGVLPRPLLIELARRAIETWRTGEGAGSAVDIANSAARRLGRLRPGRLVNATGVLLHTNLGRAAVSRDAGDAGLRSATGFEALEFDLDAGTRGRRGAYTVELLAAVSGAEAALVVNNNAAALLLTVAALSTDRETIVSRGELIEIGGSFRLPDIVGASGARLVEVGTTNRTRASDYRGALGSDTALLLKVHPSNYRIDGFSEEVTYADLAAIGREAGIPVAADVGSGLLDARVPWLEGRPPSWLAGEPAVRQTIEAGADLVMFSGDKLLGGPQAGLVVGRGDLIDLLARHPMARAMRIDGGRLAVLASTLEAYASGRGGEIPFWRMATLSADELSARCRAVATRAGGRLRVDDGVSLPGAGSVPGRGIPGPVLVVPDRPDVTWRALLDADPPVVARREERGVVIDLRAVDPADDGHVAAILAACRS